MRLIDADAIDERYKRIKAFNGFKVDEVINGEEIATILTQAIDAAPTVDPVKHGHWVLDESLGDYYCSVCKCIDPTFGVDVPVKDKYGKTIGFALRQSEYCCRCGAKMDEVQE